MEALAPSPPKPKGGNTPPLGERPEIGLKGAPLHFNTRWQGATVLLQILDNILFIMEDGRRKIEVHRLSHSEDGLLSSHRRLFCLYSHY